jgi:large subunit ribosomal protein L19
MNTLEKFEKEHLKELQSDKKLPKFNSGDTIKVHLKVKEGEKERIQVFEGVCIAKKNAGINSSFTVRKISYGEGIERVLPLFSPQINKIEVVKTGAVRRSKLYYLRERSGKSARIAEKVQTNQAIAANNLSNNNKISSKKETNLETKNEVSKDSGQKIIKKDEKSMTEKLPDEKK